MPGYTLCCKVSRGSSGSCQLRNCAHASRLSVKARNITDVCPVLLIDVNGIVLLYNILSCGTQRHNCLDVVLVLLNLKGN